MKKYVKLPIGCLAAMDGNSLYTTLQLNALIKKTPTCQKTVKQGTPTPFWPLREKPDYEPQFINPQYQRNLYWSYNLHNREKLELKHNFDKAPEKTRMKTYSQPHTYRSTSDTHWVICGLLIHNCLKLPTLHHYQSSDHY